MKWSKLKKTVEDRFAGSVRGRVKLYSTRYECSCGRGWITIDGKELVDFSTLASGTRYRAIYHESTSTQCAKHAAIGDAERTPGRLTEYGEFSRFDLHEACWDFVHSSIGESLASPNPLIQCLAVLDGRVGMQQLNRLATVPLHPLVAALLAVRLEAEQVRRTPSHGRS
jgi:hypothetical protein